MKRATTAAVWQRRLLVAALAATFVLAGCASTREAADEAGEEIGQAVDEIQASDTWQAISENWDEFRDSAAERWRELTADDLDDIGGNRESLIEEVSEAYDMTATEAEEEVDDWAESVE